MPRDPLAYLDDELQGLRDKGLFRLPRVLDGEQAARASFDHRSVVNLSSNNYLGLTTHPLLRQRAREALQAYGVGTGSVRTIAGTMALRWWVIATLGERWTTRVIVVPGEPAIGGGPYRFLRHPNYLAVAVELFAIPLLHTAWATAALWGGADLALLAVRIRAEDRALAAAESPS